MSGQRSGVSGQTWERTDEDESEAVGHGAVLVVFWDGILDEISGYHRCKGQGEWTSERWEKCPCMQARACFLTYSTQTINGVSTCIPLQIPRTDSPMLSTTRPFFSALILAPDDSRISCTFRSIPFASSRCSGITLSRPFTGGRSAVRGSGRGRPTVKAARDGLVAVALPDHELDVWVLLRDALHVP